MSHLQQLWIPPLSGKAFYQGGILWKDNSIVVIDILDTESQDLQWLRGEPSLYLGRGRQNKDCR